MRKVQTVRRGEVIEVRTPGAATVVIDASLVKGRVVIGVTHSGGVDVSNPITPLPIPLDHGTAMTDSVRR